MEATLDNGVSIAVVADPYLTRVAVVHRVSMGAAHEGPNEEGYAHLAEHLMFDEAWWAATDAVGGWSNAMTTHDATLYMTEVPPAALPDLLGREAARFANRHVAASDLTRERAVVADELRLRETLEPEARLRRGLVRGVLDGHPYGEGVGGREVALSAAAADGLEAWIARAHTGVHLHVVVVGPHDPHAVFDEIKDRYAALPAGTRRADVRPPIPSRKRLRVTERGAVRKRLAGIVWTLPPDRPCTDGEASGCSHTYWEDELALGLLDTKGRRHLTQKLSVSSRMFTPIDVMTYRGEQGGFVFVAGTRSSSAGVAANNTGLLLLALFGAPSELWRVNPTPRRIRRLLQEEAVVWVTDGAIRDARAVLVRRALAGAWNPTHRALSLAERMGRGLSVQDAPSRALGAVSVDQVRDRYHDLVEGKGVRVRVR